MRTEIPTMIRLADYRPPNHLVDEVRLEVTLDGADTIVRAEMKLRPNPSGDPNAPLSLDGDELNLVSVALDGRPIDPQGYKADPQRFLLPQPPRGAFTLTFETRLDPERNTKLMGLYRSSGVYTTQCEAEGFRRITYFPDRPDVMAVFTTRIIARKDECPVLLGNGNPVETGDLADGRHYAVWHDPHPKPAYLFALVGGRLDRVGGTFTTRSGREVELGIHVEAGKADRAGYALDALIRSMRWDEEAFGCEYDLDVFNIVAVSDFNMGAMENKGLNIFNDKYVLATPDTATDGDYASIEAIVAHEYFHNWTGNRITCRDWFQLCLKEGLTVFRDQEFSADMRSRPVKRISDVRALRAVQFAEDSGPLAHPVRPSAYREINNFYTATVYEKGAELIRMLKTLIGGDAFRRGMNLYFTRCDNSAATIEDFLACFAEASGRDLSHFAQWYEQAGTPKLTVAAHYDEHARRFRLDFEQITAPTPDQPNKRPMVIPVALGLVGRDGRAVEAEIDDPRFRDGVFVLDAPQASLVFTGVETRPVPSVLRGFSAPVRLETDLSDDDLLVLFRHDADSFNRWQAAQTLAMRKLVRAVEAIRAGRNPVFDDRFADALGALLESSTDHAFVAQVFALPTESDVAREIGSEIDPDAIFMAREGLRAAVGRRLGAQIDAAQASLAGSGPYSPDAASAGRRSLRNVLLDLLAAGDAVRGTGVALELFESADNMTERFGALAVLSRRPGDAREAALATFAERYAGDALVLDKWFALEATIPEAGTLDRIRRLMDHPAFSMTNPNRVRALIGSFAAANPTQFNRPDGAGYDFVADIALELDRSNPQVAARLLNSFRTWRALEPTRRAAAQAALERIARADGLSPDVNDIVTRAIG
jgi:aminopeptidase N